MYLGCFLGIVLEYLNILRAGSIGPVHDKLSFSSTPVSSTSSLATKEVVPMASVASGVLNFSAAAT